MKDKLIESDRKGMIAIKGVPPSGQYFLMMGKDYILLKKVTEPTPTEKLEKTVAEIEKRFNQLGIKKTDIAKAIKWARKK